MRSVQAVALVAICVLTLGVLLAAEQNKYGVADTRTVTFDEPIYVGTTLLPKGEYQVKHTMKGEEHVMVFRQMGVKNPVEASVKCTLVPLPHKADLTAKSYSHNDAQQHVLSELVFKGDTAKHVF